MSEEVRTEPGCGHHHGHQHGEGEEHHCHGHTHSHGKAVPFWKLDTTHVSGEFYQDVQEEAAVISGSLQFCMNQEEAQAWIRRSLEAVAQAVQERGALIGHIKASMESTGVRVYSITDETLFETENPSREHRVKLAFIVFHIEAEALGELVKEILEQQCSGLL